MGVRDGGNNKKESKRTLVWSEESDSSQLSDYSTGGVYRSYILGVWIGGRNTGKERTRESI